MSSFHRRGSRGLISYSRPRIGVLGGVNLTRKAVRGAVMGQRVLSSMHHLVRFLPSRRHRIMCVHFCRSLDFGRVTRRANMDVGASLKHVHCTVLGLHHVTRGGKIILAISWVWLAYCVLGNLFPAFWEGRAF